MSSSLFFPKLTRRAYYKRTRTGTYYQDYSEYRIEIREDCLGRCVYCDCHENELGGHESMNLDHFRPKGNPNFAHLVNDPSNLVWSCRRCNGLKLDHWPAIDIAVTFIDNYGFIDPFGVNRLDYFFVDDSGELHPLQPPAAYMIDLLGLNSHTPQVKRRQRIEAANQVIQIDEMLFKLNQQHELTEEQENWIDLLRKNRVVLERVLDFDLY